MSPVKMNKNVPGDDFARVRPESVLLSIVIPLLEPDEEFERCLACIMCAFSGEDFPEVIVVTPHQFVERVRTAYPWVRVFPESRKSIYGAMNDGLRVSSGDYLYFLGKDDVVLPGIRRAIAAIERHRPYVLFGDVYFGGKGVYSGKPSRFRILLENVCHQGVIYSRESLETHGPYFRKMRLLADHFLNIKIIWNRKDYDRLFYLKIPLAWYSDGGASQTTKGGDRVFWRLYPNTLRRYVGWWASCLVIAYRALRGRK